MMVNGTSKELSSNVSISPSKILLTSITAPPPDAETNGANITAIRRAQTKLVTMFDDDILSPILPPMRMGFFTFTPKDGRGLCLFYVERSPENV